MFLGIMTFIIIWFVVSKVLRMELLGVILDGLVNVGAFALIVLFQEEIRRFSCRWEEAGKNPLTPYQSPYLQMLQYNCREPFAIP